MSTRQERRAKRRRVRAWVRRHRSPRGHYRFGADYRMEAEARLRRLSAHPVVLPPKLARMAHRLQLAMLCLGAALRPALRHAAEAAARGRGRD